jgi:3-deoxy-D-manno-octulosonate cytidylyltransferase
VIAVIPARYASTRFPGKLLCLLHGTSILSHVIARARRVPGLTEVYVATDDERIAADARAAGAEVRMTSSSHPSGTDRIGEVVRGLTTSPDFVVNLQGDEPLFSPGAIGRMITAMRRQPDAIWTLADPIADEAEFLRPSAVKVVTAPDGRALYFSRAPIPFVRGGGGRPVPGSPLRHVGVYGYPRVLLDAFLAAPRGRLEEIEGLEQLRALEAGLLIRVQVGAWPDPGIDTPEDLERTRAKYPTPEELERAGAEEA